MTPPIPVLPDGYRLLYQVLAGSHSTGLATPESDEDWRGVYQAPTREFLGLTQPKETIDLYPDQTYWELGHFARLCLRGNPNIMELLWTPLSLVTVQRHAPTTGIDPMTEIRDIRTSFFTTSMVAAYLGWVTKERRILGNVDKYDVLTGKRGSHLVRLLIGLDAALTTGVLPVRMEGTDRDLVMAIKLGEVNPTSVLGTIDARVERCKMLAKQANWPESDPRAIKDIVVRARMEIL
jgi:hypothetical protein